jgi:hypothetical protein
LLSESSFTIYKSENEPKFILQAGLGGIKETLFAGDEAIFLVLFFC